MSNYVGALKYQAPYRSGSTVTYEPDGSALQGGSNLTDYATFCQDCHSSPMSAYGLSHTPIDWATSAGDKHGKRAANATSGNYIDIDAPFSNTSGGQYVLACTDCHEPHGAPNLMLIRKEVNGAALSGTISTLTP
ncbi:MAG: cytochrome c3 family protein, partial [Thermodesulfovibrionales bacterium]|nr:cytochrome c3 family protein [Thermodesulfovibrionales bacterium]